jgi:ATP-dependent Clp protease adapter protein ClpS
MHRQNSPQNLMFQIHKNGSAVDGISYASLEEAAAALAKAAQGGEVTQVDRLDQVVRRYTVDECRNARNSYNKI